MDSTGVKIAWVDVKSYEYPLFYTLNWQRKKLNILGDFENQTPTHIDATHAISKILQNFQNRNSQEFNRSLYISRIGIIFYAA